MKGAEIVFKVAAKHGIRRVVYTSSVASIGFPTAPPLFDQP